MDTPKETQRFADDFRHATLAHERLVLCVCGCSSDDAKLVADALKKVARIKLQMSAGHQISIARFHGSSLTVLQEFTRDAGSLRDALDRVVALTDSDAHSWTNNMDDLLRDAGRYFSSYDQQISTSAIFRLAVICRHDEKSPATRFTQSEPSIAFLSHPRFHLDAIYWHTGISGEEAQSTFDELCALESPNPFAKAYFLEVSGSIERLFQALALILSHPAHRLDQVAAEDLLEASSAPVH